MMQTPKEKKRFAMKAEGKHVYGYCLNAQGKPKLHTRVRLTNDEGLIKEEDVQKQWSVCNENVLSNN